MPPKAVLGANRGYLDKWQDFRNSAKDVLDAYFYSEDQDFPHSREALAKRPVRYESVTDDTPILPAHVFDCRVIIEDKAKEICEGAVARLLELTNDTSYKGLSERVTFVPGSARLRLYYGGVMIVWCELTVDRVLDAERVAALVADGDAEETHKKAEEARNEAERALKQLERFGVAWLQEFAKRVDDRLRDAFDPSPGMPWKILTPAETDRAATAKTDGVGTALADFFNWQESSRGLAFWVTRSIIVDKQTSENSEYMRIWLKPVRADSDLPEEGYSMTWLRYTFDLDRLAKQTPTFDDAWESMLFSQFIWAALERVEFRMFQVLGHVDSALGPKALKRSYANLDKVREEAELTLVHHRHLMRYLTRERVRLVDKILRGWGFKGLIENLQSVIAFARTRHEQLLQKAAAKSSFFTDQLLFLIGSVAVVNFLVSISITGRRLASEPGIGRRDEGFFIDIFGTLSGWPINRVFISAIIIIAVVFVALYWARQRQQY